VSSSSTSAVLNANPFLNTSPSSKVSVRLCDSGDLGEDEPDAGLLLPLSAAIGDVDKRGSCCGTFEGDGIGCELDADDSTVVESSSRSSSLSSSDESTMLNEGDVDVSELPSGLVTRRSDNSRDRLRPGGGGSLSGGCGGDEDEEEYTRSARSQIIASFSVRRRQSSARKGQSDNASLFRQLIVTHLLSRDRATHPTPRIVERVQPSPDPQDREQAQLHPSEWRLVVVPEK
jgi:hypothetical protein